VSIEYRRSRQPTLERRSPRGTARDERVGQPPDTDAESIWSDEFLADFRHSFLIRDPFKTLTSMHHKWADFHIKEAGFPEQRALFGRLSDLHGEPPPVIDSDDLFERPAEMVEAWWAAVGIRFIADALMWEPGPRDEVSGWDGGSFPQNVRGSDGLKRLPRAEIELAGTATRVREAYAIVEPQYGRLYEHRVVVA